MMCCKCRARSSGHIRCIYRVLANPMYDASVSFKHVCVKFDDVLQMQSTQQRLIPMLATCYGLHFAKQLLVDRYCEMKRTKDHKLVEEV